MAKNNLKQLTKDNRQPTNLVFLNDGRLSFKSGNAIYAIHPDKGLYEQLVSWQFADEPTALEEPEDTPKVQDKKPDEDQKEEKSPKDNADVSLDDIANLFK